LCSRYKQETKRNGLPDYQYRAFVLKLAVDIKNWIFYQQHSLNEIHLSMVHFPCNFSQKVVTFLVVRFCHHRTIPMMRFAAYYVSTIGCNSNLCVNFETLSYVTLFQRKVCFCFIGKKCFSECEGSGARTHSRYQLES
jgi:hypothetical protein